MTLRVHSLELSVYPDKPCLIHSFSGMAILTTRITEMASLPRARLTERAVRMFRLHRMNMEVDWNTQPVLLAHYYSHDGIRGKSDVVCIKNYNHSPTALVGFFEKKEGERYHTFRYFEEDVHPCDKLFSEHYLTTRIVGYAKSLNARTLHPELSDRIHDHCLANIYYHSGVPNERKT